MTRTTTIPCSVSGARILPPASVHCLPTIRQTLYARSSAIGGSDSYNEDQNSIRCYREMKEYSSWEAYYWRCCAKTSRVPLNARLPLWLWKQGVRLNCDYWFRCLFFLLWQWRLAACLTNKTHSLPVKFCTAATRVYNFVQLIARSSLEYPWSTTTN